MTGEGGQLDVNLLNSALALQQSSITSYLADGELPVRSGSAAPYSAPNQAFETADGWIMVAAYTPERWERLCELLGLPGLATRSALRDLAAARGEPAARWSLRSPRCSRRAATDDWLPALRAADILCSRVATYADVMRASAGRGQPA